MVAATVSVRAMPSCKPTFWHRRRRLARVAHVCGVLPGRVIDYASRGAALLVR